jgi:hypothetical protein
MGVSWQSTFRDRLVMAVGAVLLAAGLLALSVPVSLGDYDSWGMQVECGNGYYSQLLQATFDDEESARQSARDGAPTAIQPNTNYVDRCKSAITHRRAWAIPIAGLGAVILLVEVFRWVRNRPTDSGSATTAHAWSAEHPDDVMHEAAVLDRRERSHQRPSDTTL